MRGPYLCKYPRRTRAPLPARPRATFPTQRSDRPQIDFVRVWPELFQIRVSSEKRRKNTEAKKHTYTHARARGYAHGRRGNEHPSGCERKNRAPPVFNRITHDLPCADFSRVIRRAEENRPENGARGAESAGVTAAKPPLRRRGRRSGGRTRNRENNLDIAASDYARRNVSHPICSSRFAVIARQ